MVITKVDTYHVSMWCEWNVIGQLSRKKLLQELFWDTSVVNDLDCDLERKRTKYIETSYGKSCIYIQSVTGFLFPNFYK